MKNYQLLQDVADVIMGQSPPSSTYNEDGRGLPFFQGKAEFGERNPIPQKWCNAPKKIAEPNDILISVRAPVGPTNICDVQACVGRGLAAIRPHKGKLEYRFLWFYLRSIEKQIAQKGVGSTFTAIGKNQLGNIPVPNIDHRDQLKIANILEKAEAAREKRRKANRLTDEFLKSAFLEMFGDPATNPNNFRTGKLGNVLHHKNAIKCGPFGSQLKIGEYVQKGIPVYGIDNVAENEFIEAKPKKISEEKYNQLKAFWVKPKDILITRTGTVGRTCLAPDNVEKAVIGPNLLKITSDRDIFLPEYLSYSFNYSDPIKQQIRLYSPGATVAVYNTTNLKKLKLIVPLMEFQQKFVDLVHKVERLKEKQRESEIELNNLFNSLMQKSFKGELVF